MISDYYFFFLYQNIYQSVGAHADSRVTEFVSVMGLPKTILPGPFNKGCNFEIFWSFCIELLQKNGSFIDIGPNHFIGTKGPNNFFLFVCRKGPNI
jgi:hypothetical protein